MLGWAHSEAGKAAVLTDLDGKPIWSHKRGGFGGATAVGLDNGVAYIVDTSVIYKLRTSDSVVVPWSANGAGEMTVREILGDPSAPEAATGVAVRAGKLYITNPDLVAIVDADSGKLERKVALPGAGAITPTAKGAYVIVGGKSLVFVDAASGAIKTVIKTLASANSVAVDTTGNFFIGQSDPINQVQVYDATGKLTRTIGRKGGRATIGPWQADGLFNISTVGVDSLNRLWVGEGTQMPMRFSQWDPKTGKLIREYFGPTRYGASGATINPDDPNVMVGEGVEWKLDPATGKASAIGIVDTEFYAFARFAKYGGREYLAGTVSSYIGGAGATPSADQGIRISERIAPGQYKLRSTIYCRKPNTPDAYTEFWSDRNDDQKVQPDELSTIPGTTIVGGYYLWSMYMNSDLTFYGGTNQSSTTQVKVSGLTACGAPIFDIANAKKLPGTGGLSSLDNKYLLTQVQNPVFKYTLHDISTGAETWSYPDIWMGVHGSHNAPAPETGLIRGSFGVVGSAKLPEPVGDIWAINGNVGEWHLLTRDGYYLSRLFQPDGMKVNFPAEAKPGADMTDAASGLGGEDFGGSMTQGKDGKVYVEAGKTGLWNTEVTGLDTIQSLGNGEITIANDDLKTAQGIRETLLQENSDKRSLGIKKMSIDFTGNFDTDFKDASTISFKKTDDAAIRSSLAWDEGNLYVGWEVSDPTPWINNATAPEYMYAHGDTVDLQLGTDPSADPKRGEAGLGDLRLSIGQVAGKPTAVVYRKVAADKAPKHFSSGIVRDYVMESVKVLDSADIQVKVDAAGKRYFVEAAIPLAALGLKPTDGLAIRADIGATHSNQGGDDTRLRTYWSNQETGIVDDEVYELMMQPKNWGEFTFKN